MTLPPTIKQKLIQITSGNNDLLNHLLEFSDDHILWQQIRELALAQRLNEIQSMQLNSKTPEDKSKLYDIIQRFIAKLEQTPSTVNSKDLRK